MNDGTSLVAHYDYDGGDWFRNPNNRVTPEAVPITPRGCRCGITLRLCFTLSIR